MQSSVDTFLGQAELLGIKALSGDVNCAKSTLTIAFLQPLDLELTERTFAVVEQGELGGHVFHFAVANDWMHFAHAICSR